MNSICSYNAYNGFIFPLSIPLSEKAIKNDDIYIVDNGLCIYIFINSEY